MMGRAAADDDDIKTFDLEHGREGVASIGVGLVLVVGGEAGAHFFVMLMALIFRCPTNADSNHVPGPTSKAPEMRLLEMRSVGCRRTTAVLQALLPALEDDKE